MVRPLFPFQMVGVVMREISKLTIEELLMMKIPLNFAFFPKTSYNQNRL